jgi:chorismate dehydratase
VFPLVEIVLPAALFCGFLIGKAKGEHSLLFPRIFEECYFAYNPNLNHWSCPQGPLQEIDFPVKSIRCGAVSYLNSKPLIENWPLLAPQANLTLDLPSRLADGLSRGAFDVALIPSVEYFSQAGYSILSDACIACHGPVWSVKVVFRTVPEKVRTLALDEGSRTSASLAQILLRERLGLSPILRPFPIAATIESISADALVVIGDRAMHLNAEPWTEVWDLGQEWIADTGLPFVFAMWVARAGFDSPELAKALSTIRDQGVAATSQIADREAARYGLTSAAVLKYFQNHLHFRLGEPERRGLAEFRRRAARLGLIPSTSKCLPPHSPETIEVSV